MNLHSSMNRKPSVLSKRISLAGFSAVAVAAAMMISTDSAHAGAAELALITKNLPSGAVVANPNVKKGQRLATFSEILTAVGTAVSTNTSTKIHIGAIAGEALKSPAALGTVDAGSQIATKVLASLPAAPTGAALQSLLADAAKAAGTSKGANTLRVADFVASVLPAAGATSTDDAKAAAALAIASKSGAAAILAGRASQLSDADATTLASTAILDKKLGAAVTEISRAVSATLDNNAAVATFATTLSAAKTSVALKVAPAVVASNINSAGDVTEALLANATVKPVVLKGVASYAKAVAAVADIEQITLIGSALAQEIGKNTTGIKITSAAALTKTLATAIFAKPSSNSSGYNVANKKDEIAEVAAYVVGGILGNAGFSDASTKTLKASQTVILGIIKSAIASGKTANKALKADATALAATNYIADIIGSVARTLVDADPTKVSDTLEAKLKDFLLNDKQIKALAGKNTVTQDQVRTALELAFNTITNPTPAQQAQRAALENGNDLTRANIVDPETDIRNY